MGMRLCNGDGLGWGLCTGEVTPNCNGNCVNLAGDPSNCGTCGNACSGGANGAATCTGGGCGFTCNSGFRHCNGQAGNGCECEGTGCCSGGSCQARHSNGLGQSYFDCFALGTPGTASTYTATMAN